MSALAALLTLMPLALALGEGAKMQQPLAIAIVAGLVLEVPLVLVVLPALLQLVLRGNAGSLGAGAETAASNGKA